MSKSPLVCTSLDTADVERYSQEFLLNCKYQQLSATTIEVRRIFLKNLIWFLKHRGFTECATSPQLREFFLYLRTGHEEPCGRWGNPNLRKPLRPVSVKDYYICLKIFFDWMVSEGLVETSPLERIERPQAREEVKQPLSADQTQSLLQAARNSSKPHRNEAILLMLFDSGVRASELISIRVRDIDLQNCSFEVTGKGNKKRMCYLGRNTARSITVYLRKAKLAPDSALFPCTSDNAEPLSRSGLLHLIKRLAKKAGVSANVHQLRRTFATSMLENGADIISVRDMLGHTNIQMTLKYLSVAQSHIESQHRKFSPGDRLNMK